MQVKASLIEFCVGATSWTTFAPHSRLLQTALTPDLWQRGQALGTPPETFDHTPAGVFTGKARLRSDCDLFHYGEELRTEKTCSQDRPETF
ncbi:hypothetical protein TNCV_2340211 [Trichonephila clavipes]|nr:hypothetical protein TNCV_2340211 [Trichonephila clavipes]